MNTRRTHRHRTLDPPKDVLVFSGFENIAGSAVVDLLFPKWTCTKCTSEWTNVTGILHRSLHSKLLSCVCVLICLLIISDWPINYPPILLSGYVFTACMFGNGPVLWVGKKENFVAVLILSVHMTVCMTSWNILVLKYPYPEMSFLILNCPYSEVHVQSLRFE